MNIEATTGNTLSGIMVRGSPDRATARAAAAPAMSTALPIHAMGRKQIPIKTVARPSTTAATCTPTNR